MRRYLFVGEEPSEKARRIGATWQNGRLCAKTLHEAIRAVGLVPDEQQFLNLFEGDESCALEEIRRARAEGIMIVALGRRVSDRLSACHVPHLQLVHPAARGAIRKTARYHAHVREVLK